MLVGNKIDKVRPGDLSAVTAEQGGAMCRKLGGWASLQCSAKEYGLTKGLQGKVEEVFKAAIKCGLYGKGYFDEPGLCNNCNCILL